MPSRKFVAKFDGHHDNPRVLQLEGENLLVGFPEFTGADAGKHLIVNGDGTDIIWGAVPQELPAVALADAGKHLIVNAAGTGCEWAAIAKELPELPSDASTKTYALQAVNGVLGWVEVTE